MEANCFNCFKRSLMLTKLNGAFKSMIAIAAKFFESTALAMIDWIIIAAIDGPFDHSALSPFMHLFYGSIVDDLVNVLVGGICSNLSKAK
jgi:hypothetical protein